MLGGTAAGRAGAAREGRAVSCSPVRLTLQPGVIDLYHDASISVTGLTGGPIEVRLLGAIDRFGPAYEWTPYRWERLHRRHGSWSGALTAPPLYGVYQLQLRLGHRRRLLSQPCWLLRVFPRGTTTRPRFATPVAALRYYVAHLPGHEVLVHVRPWPLPAYDHRNGHLNRLFVIAYAPRGHSRHGAQLGKFVTTVREGFHGRWRLLQATSGPPD